MSDIPAADWIWIPLVLAAAGAQTVRNAAQRSLVQSAGTLAATLVRFLYGLPFAVLILLLVLAFSSAPLPAATAPFLGWIAIGATAQLGATAFLIGAMERGTFVVAVTYSKTEIVQIALFSVALLAEPLTFPMVVAIGLASAGVLMLSVKSSTRPMGSSSWISRAVVLGLASGGGFALSAVGYRGAAVALSHPLPWVSGAFALVWAQGLQTLLLGGYMAVRERNALVAVLANWRVSTLAGASGTLASVGWLTAFAMRSAVDVRIVGLVEVLYSYLLSRRMFTERVSRRETIGILLVVAGIVVVSVLGK